MIFRSRITKQLSNVIEQNALSRSPGSSMSLIRTSVISTVVLLTTEGSLRDTSRRQTRLQTPEASKTPSLGSLRPGGLTDKAARKAGEPPAAPGGRIA